MLRSVERTQVCPPARETLAANIHPLRSPRHLADPVSVATDAGRMGDLTVTTGVEPMVDLNTADLHTDRGTRSLAVLNTANLHTDHGTSSLVVVTTPTCSRPLFIGYSGPSSNRRCSVFTARGSETRP